MIQDSGERKEFESGAVRDVQKGKGRCDLLPLDVLTDVTGYTYFTLIDDFVRHGDTENLIHCIETFAEFNFGDLYTAILETSIHYEEGAEKYVERNWERGIPAHSFVNSAVRHLCKHFRGDKDERHDRAFLWNLFGLLWTVRNKPEYNDLPYVSNEEIEEDGEEYIVS